MRFFINLIKSIFSKPPICETCNYVEFCDYCGETEGVSTAHHSEGQEVTACERCWVELEKCLSGRREEV